MYGYLHRGRIISVDEDSGGFVLQSIGLARTSRWGPVQSTVPGLAVGDQAILGATGTSRDDLVIIAKVGADFPEIGDIPGLVAALAGKADDSEITALDGRLDTAEAELVTLDGRLDTAEGALVALDGRLDTAEAELVIQDGRLDTAEGTLVTLDSRVDSLELSSSVMDRDLYGDVLANMPRHSVVNSLTLANGTLNVIRLFCRSAFTATFIRMVTGVAGVAGTGNIALYAGTATNALSQVRSGTISLGGPGRVTHTLSSTYAIAANTHLAIALLPLSYTTQPQVGGRSGIVSSTMLNPTGALFTSVTKGSVASLPATIDLTDGSWTSAVTSVPWIALA